MIAGTDSHPACSCVSCSVAVSVISGAVARNAYTIGGCTNVSTRAPAMKARVHLVDLAVFAAPTNELGKLGHLLQCLALVWRPTPEQCAHTRAHSHD